YQRVFSHEPTTTPREGYLMFVRTTNGDPSTFSLERWLDGGVDQCPTTAAVTQGAWHHLVATYDGTTSTIYLDGTPVATQPSAHPLLSTTASLLMGLGTYDPAPFTGSLDEIAVYDEALPAARVAAHYHASGR
ncbi:MAG TPA: LamG domain-containing protein, partial [Polyangiaceae bacterium]